MRKNRKPNYNYKVPTYERGAGRTFSPNQELKRLVFNCLLGERNFYIDGEAVESRIREVAQQVPSYEIARIAKEARHEHGLRHVPLLLLNCLLDKRYKETAKAIEEVVSRPDEMGELLSIYWENGKKPLAAQLKKGLARLFHKFSEYQFAKWNKRSDKIKIRDVMFLVHPKPRNKEEETLFCNIANNTLPAPNTWEVRLSAGEDKRHVFESLIRERQIGAIALLKNLRNMAEAGCDECLVAEAINRIGQEPGRAIVRPIDVISAYTYSPKWHRELDALFRRLLREERVLPGKTLILVDVSGSMDDHISKRSEMTYADYAAGIATMIRSEEKVVYTFSDREVKVKGIEGSMDDIKRIIRSQPHSGTYLGQSLKAVHKKEKCYDRIIVVTDEQVHDGILDPLCPKNHAYLVNVASYSIGVDERGKWTRVDGTSFSVVRWIIEREMQNRK